MVRRAQADGRFTLGLATLASPRTAGHRLQGDVGSGVCPLFRLGAAPHSRTSPLGRIELPRQPQVHSLGAWSRRDCGFFFVTSV